MSIEVFFAFEVHPVVDDCPVEDVVCIMVFLLHEELIVERSTHAYLGCFPKVLELGYEL